METACVDMKQRLVLMEVKTANMIEQANAMKDYRYINYDRWQHM